MVPVPWPQCSVDLTLGIHETCDIYVPLMPTSLFEIQQHITEVVNK